MKRAMLLSSFVLLQACSSTPISPMEAHSVPPAAGFITNRAQCLECGSVRITRDIGFMGGCSVTVFFDGSKVTELSPGETVSFLAEQGQHVVEAQPWALCAGNKVGAVATVQSRRESNFRVGRDNTGSLILSPTY